MFNAGKTPKEWNEKILKNQHFKVVWYKPSQEVFDNVDIKGGVAVTLCNNTVNFGALGVYTKYSELSSILNKVINHTTFIGLDTIIFPQNKFDLDSLYQDLPILKTRIGSNGKEKRLTTSIFSFDEIFYDETKGKDYVKILGLIGNKREWKWMKSKYLDSHPNFYKWKVILPKVNGTGELGETLSSPFVAEPAVGITQSFISFGAFDEEKMANSVLKYIKTKFVRTLLSVLKVTQDNPKETWKYIPVQNFTENSDIDWGKSVEDIDRQLYEKYGLDDKEIAFIESKIKPM